MLQGVWVINQLLTVGLAAPAVWHPLPSVTGGLGLLTGVGNAAGVGQGNGLLVLAEASGKC